MAKLVSELKFTGTIGDLTAYKMRGSDKIILRAKGGPSKEKIKNDPQLFRIRENNKEFGGRAVAAKNLMWVLAPLKFIADQGLAGPLNALLKPIQVADTESERGKRHVVISKNPGLLQGFNFNKRNFFDAMIRNQVTCNISKEDLSTTIEFPTLIPGINFFPPEGNFPYFRIMALLGIVPDYFYKSNDPKYRPGDEFGDFVREYKTSEWLPVNATSQPMNMKIQLPSKKYQSAFSLIVAAGVQFGKVAADGTIDPIKYVGSAKILASL